MIPIATLLLFALACLALAATPGPNVLYLASRTIAQGRAAGFVSLAGTATGLLAHILAAVFGLSALLAAVPVAFDAVRWAGAAYLAWLAWQALRGAGAAAADVAPRRSLRLWRDGVATALLNPKVALFELALFPQFIDPAHGSVLAQGLALGAIQLAIVTVCDAAFVLLASRIRRWLGARPAWSRWSSRVLAGVFAALAARLALDARD